MATQEPQPTLKAGRFNISYGANDDRLRDFYIPALEASVRFDRTTGFFSSTALAIAAAGIVRLIANGGHMRLLCGAKLSEDDVEAVRRGEELSDVVGRAMAGSLADPNDQSVRARLEALAWLVANNRLEMRVVLPRDQQGLPLPAEQAREYFHPKEGVFEDAEGNRLAFSGSVNDSENGWEWNYETFTVYTTWERKEGDDLIPDLSVYVRRVEDRFRRLWHDEEEDWVGLPIPEAARQRLLSYCPSVPPAKDPLEAKKPVASPVPTSFPAPADERLVFQFLREAPRLPNAGSLALETSNVQPWPHQQRVVDEVVKRYPESFLFCDEVGLGKTIEAGLALRQLVLSGKVRRALLLVPASVLRQWQEELWEKCVLNVPRYEGGVFKDVFERELPPSSGNPWSAYPLLLASSQLAKRRERQTEVIAAGPWDLVLIDEAHHARRKDFKEDRRRPNRLLELLDGAGGRPGLKTRTRCLYMMTATPMQVAPVEVWDLLKVLGLGGRWGAFEENFLRYFKELRLPPSERDWRFVLAMIRDYLDGGGAVDPMFAEAARDRLGLVTWESIKTLPYSSKPKAVIDQLDTDGRACLEAFAHHHTPLRTFMWRNTRNLLRRYKEKGIIKENIPRRRPENIWVDLVGGIGSERELYDRIEEYISGFYQKYESERKGLGFVMTVYRRRLTSSFFALERSLERRQAFLLGQLTLGETLGDEDVEQEELDADVGETLVGEDRSVFGGELEYVNDFLHSLRMLSTDSKLERLFEDLKAVFMKRETVIIFTQYTDTMDYLRDRLRETYGHHIACYSGRGGERWDGVGWMPRSKEDVKTAFRDQEIKILLCTESASEGLNLQTCGVLINYDMPWNPMRVEQRIGRIDRIGQLFAEVWVRNYFYAETVEATVYQRLEDRIGWFEDVVGELQPILHQVASVIQDAAMLRGDVRARRLEEALAQIRRDIDEKQVEGLDLDAYLALDPAVVEAAPAPVTLKQLEAVMLRSAALGRHFKPHPELPNVYTLAWDGAQTAVTFDPKVFDAHPDTVQLLSYGNPLLDRLLESVPEPLGADNPSGVSFYRAAAPTPMSLFVRPADGGAAAVSTLTDLTASPGTDAEWDAAVEEAADRLFTGVRTQALEQMGRVAEQLIAGERLALKEEARQILVRTAVLGAAEAQTATLFDQPLPYSFGSEAVAALRERGAPYKGLWTLLSGEELSADPTDPFFLSVQGLPLKSLQRRREQLRLRGMDVLTQYRLLSERAVAQEISVSEDAAADVETHWYATSRRFVAGGTSDQ